MICLLIYYLFSTGKWVFFFFYEKEQPWKEQPTHQLSLHDSCFEKSHRRCVLLTASYVRNTKSIMWGWTCLSCLALSSSSWDTWWKVRALPVVSQLWNQDIPPRMVTKQGRTVSLLPVHEDSFVCNCAVDIIYLTLMKATSREENRAGAGMLILHMKKHSY